MMGPVEIITQLVFGASLIAVLHVIVLTVAPAIPRMIELLRGGWQ